MRKAVFLRFPFDLISENDKLDKNLPILKRKKEKIAQNATMKKYLWNLIQTSVLETMFKINISSYKIEILFPLRM